MDTSETGSQQRLLAMKGLPGSGKSSLALEIARRTGWRVVDKDDAKDVLHGRSSDAGHLAYQTSLEEIERHLMNGESVIYDSPLTFRSLYGEICLIAARTRTEPLIVECLCSDEDELRRRIEERSGVGLPSHRITGWSEFLAYRERTSTLSDYAIDGPYLMADTTRPLSELIESAMQWLSAERVDG